MSKSDFYYDIVFCIDKTKNCFDQYVFISEFIDSFGNQLRSQLRSANIKLARLRAKIVEFGDFNADAEPIVEHGFFDLATQSGEFSDLLFDIRINGASSKTGYSNGFEAITCAIKSDWQEEQGSSGRQAIVVFTKNSPFAIEQTSKLSKYPADYPKTFSEFKKLWEDGGEMNKRKKMLVSFCPMGNGGSDWVSLMEWDGVIMVDTQDINEYNNDFIMETLLIDLI